jgi:hypothetical protein
MLTPIYVEDIGPLWAENSPIAYILPSKELEPLQCEEPDYFRKPQEKNGARNIKD